MLAISARQSAREKYPAPLCAITSRQLAPVVESLYRTLVNDDSYFGVFCMAPKYGPYSCAR